MIIQPKIRGFICTTAHPEGCKKSVQNQVDYVVALGKKSGIKKALVIGSSTGYGLSSRIAMAFGDGAATIGVAFEREAAGIRTATAGWYNSAAFEQIAHSKGLYAKTFNGDAYSKEMKEKVVKTIVQDLGKVDAVIYSLASPRRVMEDGTVYNSVLKPTEKEYTNKTIDLRTNELSLVTILPATKEEIDATIKVMGGEDWAEWIDALVQADAIEKDALTLAYSYIGPQLTHPIYYNGSIGAAKRDLYYTAEALRKKYGLEARIAVNKALVTQASSAIPVVPLYTSILYKIMKKKGLHEGCIQQMSRLFFDKLRVYDEDGYIRLDDYEMQQNVQAEVQKEFDGVNAQNLTEVADLSGYWDDFYHMFGFGYSDVDYSADVPADVKIPSLQDAQ